ncbi:MAG: hypothetical protein DRQ39_10830 [Gammaproteobacteria bacterium]|nr:MAG: hypothetical protein DRQ39_10830 [Gammaproteobacteria bacterium]
MEMVRGELMNTLLLLVLFNLPEYQADYKCDSNVEIHNLCTMPYIEWYIEPITQEQWQLA